MKKYDTHNAFFNSVIYPQTSNEKHSIPEMKDKLFLQIENSKTKYNELIKDFKDYIHNQVGIDEYIYCTGDEKEFDYKAKELERLSEEEEAIFLSDLEDMHRITFDFITIIEPNKAKVSHLKVSCKWEDDTERLCKFVYGAFKFKEACKMVIAELMQTPQEEPKAIKKDAMEKNPYETIFIDDFAFILFKKMKEQFINSTTPQADFSFLFDKMQKDKFVICSGAKFVEFMSVFDISITRIDSSKIGNKQKTLLYIAIKEILQKKHGLSTV